MSEETEGDRRANKSGKSFYMVLEKEVMNAAEICNLTLCCGLWVKLVPDSLIKVAKVSTLLGQSPALQLWTHWQTLTGRPALQVFGWQASSHHSFRDHINYWDCNTRDHQSAGEYHNIIIQELVSLLCPCIRLVSLQLLSALKLVHISGSCLT